MKCLKAIFQRIFASIDKILIVAGGLGGGVSRGGVHWVKCLIAIFQGISASIGEIFIVAGGLGNGVSFYGF